MSRREERIHQDLSPQELNRILIENYHYDLYDFTHSLAIVLRETPPPRLWNIWLIRKVDISDYEILSRESNRLKRIKRRLIMDLSDHFIELNSIENPIFPDEVIPGVRNFQNRNDEQKIQIVESVYKLNETVRTEPAKEAFRRQLVDGF